MIGPSIPAHLLQRRDDEDHTPEPSTSEYSGLQLPPSNTQGDSEDENDDENAWAPALPPDLEPPPARVVGPSIPTHLPPSLSQEQYDSDDDYGPMPLPAGSRSADDAGSGVREFIEREERRRKEVEV